MKFLSILPPTRLQMKKDRCFEETRLLEISAAFGGCEPQLTAHAKGNMNLGNDKNFIIKVISQCLPYIGYPRSLNAIACVNKAAE